ncbi:KGGVGR-motif variant AAA ATPase [Chryseobacterium arthrosphaerae]|uniref:KGGVGR-motif variant AAA ATPase n=1 Tax=Chryseobacterium arthrosphaerae TaxID=651561 RepID=UPI001E552E84|nr:hypothetical protein [Chryseobacterium arthrosphaerae]UEQ78195.1 hypothetical protein J8N07_07860 [Chryseobacterium arthrosphaerae]
MISILNKCNEIKLYLENQAKENIDFKIYLRTNENLYVYILVKNFVDELEIEKKIIEIFSDAEVNFLSQDLLQNDEFFIDIFSKEEIIHLENGRRRFTSLLNKEDEEQLTTCPVVTFYSYKGGMGRSTTLAAFATHLAINEAKKVVIVDCDFEAPGFTNFFLTNPRETNQRQGFVEYFFDKENGFSDKHKLENYTWKVDARFSGLGSIHIMPAGNLNTTINEDDYFKSDLNHYIEGLSRIDFTNEKYIIKKFKDILEDLNDSLKPDIILIDSRTGFSDMLGIAAFKLSKMVLGFFRNDAQSLPGLHFFIENLIENEKLEPCLINSILPESLSLKKQLFKSFEDDVQNIISQQAPESELSFSCFPISRNQNLELLGSTSENVFDFIDIIKENEIKDFKELFEYLTSRIPYKDKIDNSDIFNPGVNSSTKDLHLVENYDENKTIKVKTKEEIDNLSEDAKVEYIRDVKEKILRETSRKIDATSLYAENMSIEEQFENQQFFYRNCMNDIFNIDKPFILGSKGTGKSYIYNALQSKIIVKKLQAIANIEDDFSFIYTIDKKDRIFKVNRFNKSASIGFYYRFWLIYTWQIILKELNVLDLSFKSSIDSFDIRDDETTLKILSDKINDTDYIILIEKEFNELDKFLLNGKDVGKKFLVILYDQLDEIVHPSLWNDWIPSLIDFWRNKKYSRIFGKVFIRRDLFNGLYGLTNVNDIENQAINIEWSQEEMFSYFFKIVFSNGMSEYFWIMMYLYNDYHYELIKKNRQKYNKLEQTALEEYLLRPLATTFFGKEVDAEGSSRMGESYDWFYKNLRNGDDTISLRPFIDLLKFSIDKWKDKKYLQEEGLKPILFQKYYTDRDVRKEAVDRHFKDIVQNQIGNKPIEYLFEYIDNHKEFQFITIRKDKFYRLFKEVLEEYKDREEMKDINPKKMEELLITNGIIKKENYGRGDEYRFPFLYKYRLGLRGR